MVLGVLSAWLAVLSASLAPWSHWIYLIISTTGMIAVIQYSIFFWRVPALASKLTGEVPQEANIKLSSAGFLANEEASAERRLPRKRDFLVDDRKIKALRRLLLVPKNVGERAHNNYRNWKVRCEGLRCLQSSSYEYYSLVYISVEI
jgi:hypothetical protein